MTQSVVINKSCCFTTMYAAAAFVPVAIEQIHSLKVLHHGNRIQREAQYWSSNGYKVSFVESVLPKKTATAHDERSIY